MRKQIFCICENKGADQLRSNFEADQRLCMATRIVQFLYCDRTARFVSDLFENHNVGFLMTWLIYMSKCIICVNVM